VIQGILVGEHLMRAENPSAEMHALVSDSAKHSNKVLVKICGISRAEDALAACRAKADLIGIVFAEKSPRQVQPEDAKVIVQAVRNFRETKSAISLDSSTLAGNHDGNSDHKRARLTDWFQNGAKRLQKACSRGPLVVGVFMNQSIDFINDTVKTAELDLVQLHGNESWKTCSACLAPVIKVIHVPVVQQLSDEDILNSVEEGQGQALAVLLDTTIKGGAEGGTGQAFDWSVAQRYKQIGIPVIVAGGLTPENVQKAISHSSTPLGVDCSSGVQVNGNPREKNQELIHSFIELAKSFKE